jgi:hypothetical protein
MYGMNPELTMDEVHHYQGMMQSHHDASHALSRLEAHQGKVDSTLKELWEEKEEKSLGIDLDKFWRVTLQVIREELCGNEGFRAEVSKYAKKPESAVLLTGLITYLVGAVSLPINPAIATIVTIYILKVGLNIFCEYTEPENPSPVPA